MEFFLDNKPWHMGIDFHMRSKEGTDVVIAEPITMSRMPPGTLTHPMFTMENQAAQSLMDQLWSCGLRPSEGTGSAGSLAATQHHLADMRKIVAKKIGVEI